MSTNTNGNGNADAGERGLFVTGGKNLIVTFCLVSSLFLLWGFGNGMIDVMDKHFQEELHLSLSQSAWVQFAHYLGYFLMSLPAGWLATKLGYKGGIIAGLLMVALGGLWFIPATKIAAFWAFLFGVCIIASGFTFLETVANPYTTVLGPKRYAATRINLAQSCNGIGWLLGPIAGAMFFYSKDASGKSTGSQTLWIPYAGIAVVVIVLSVLFFLAYVPDLNTKDEYTKGDGEGGTGGGSGGGRKVSRGQVYSLLFLNLAVLTGITGMILWLILDTLGLGESVVGIASMIPHPAGMTIDKGNSLLLLLSAVGGFAVLVEAVWCTRIASKISEHNIWSHPHFSGATLAQFLYVAAQAGIFSFLINYMTTEPPAVPASWNTGVIQEWGWLDTGKDGLLHFSNQFASLLASVGFGFFLVGRVVGSALLAKYSAHKIVGLYGVLNVIATFLVVCKLGWLSVACVFLSYFFMSIMFPTIFALGIYGLGEKAKSASAFIVMAIMGGAILPKIMGAVADRYDMSRGFIVPMICFVFIALFGFGWPKLSKVDSLHGVATTGRH